MTPEAGDDDELLRVRQIEYRPDLVVVVVAGEVDISTAAVLRDGLVHAMGGAGRRVVVVDLTGVRLLAAAGLRVLTDVAVDARACGVRLGLVVPESLAMRVLRMSGVAASIPVFTALSDGIRELVAGDGPPDVGSCQDR